MANTTDPADKSTAADKSEPKAEPKASSAPALKIGGQAKHENGSTFKVLAILSEGVKLEGVANLVTPSALTPA